MRSHTHRYLWLVLAACLLLVETGLAHNSYPVSDMSDLEGSSVDALSADELPEELEFVDADSEPESVLDMDTEVASIEAAEDQKSLQQRWDLADGAEAVDTQREEYLVPEEMTDAEFFHIGENLSSDSLKLEEHDTLPFYGKVPVHTSISKETLVRTFVRGNVKTHPSWLQMQEGMHHHLNQVAKPLNARLARGALAMVQKHLGGHIQRMMAEGQRSSHMDLEDMFVSDDDDDTSEDADDDVMQKGKLIEGTDQQSFLKHVESLQQLAQDGLVVYGDPSEGVFAATCEFMAAHRDQVHVGSVFSIPSGLYRVTHITPPKGKPAWTQGQTVHCDIASLPYHLTCVNADLEDAIEDASVHVEVTDLSSLSRNEETGEVQDWSPNARAARTNQLLRKSAQRHDYVAALNRADDVAEKALLAIEQHGRDLDDVLLQDRENLEKRGVAMYTGARDRYMDVVKEYAQRIFDAQRNHIKAAARLHQAFAQSMQNTDEEAMDDEFDEEAMAQGDDDDEEEEDEEEELEDEVEVRDFFWRKVANAFNSIGEKLKKTFKAVKSFAENVYNKAAGALKQVANKVSNLVRSAVNAVVKAAKAVVRAVKEFGEKVASVAKKFGEAVKKAGEAFADKMKEVGEKIKSTAVAIGKSVKRIAVVAYKLAKFFNQVAHGGSADLDLDESLSIGFSVENIDFGNHPDKFMDMWKEKRAEDKKKRDAAAGKPEKPEKKKSKAKPSLQVMLRIIKAKIMLKPTLVLAIKMKKFMPQYVKVEFRGELDIELRTFTQINAEWKFEKEKLVGNKAITTIKFAIGPVPVWISVKAQFYLGVGLTIKAGIQFRYGGRVHGKWRIGAHGDMKTKKTGFVNKTEIKNTFGKPNGFRPCASVELEAFVRPQVAFHMYHSAGPTLGFEPFAVLTFVPQGATACMAITDSGDMVTAEQEEVEDEVNDGNTLTFEAGIRVKAGIQIVVVKKMLLDENIPLFEKKWELFEFKLTVPTKKVLKAMSGIGNVRKMLNETKDEEDEEQLEGLQDEEEEVEEVQRRVETIPTDELMAIPAGMRRGAYYTVLPNVLPEDVATHELKDADKHDQHRVLDDADAIVDEALTRRVVRDEVRDMDRMDKRMHRGDHGVNWYQVEIDTGARRDERRIREAVAHNRLNSLTFEPKSFDNSPLHGFWLLHGHSQMRKERFMLRAQLFRKRLEMLERGRMGDESMRNAFHAQAVELATRVRILDLRLLKVDQFEQLRRRLTDEFRNRQQDSTSQEHKLMEYQSDYRKEMDEARHYERLVLQFKLVRDADERTQRAMRGIADKLNDQLEVVKRASSRIEEQSRKVEHALEAMKEARDRLEFLTKVSSMQATAKARMEAHKKVVDLLHSQPVRELRAAGRKAQRLHAAAVMDLVNVERMMLSEEKRKELRGSARVMLVDARKVLDAEWRLSERIKSMVASAGLNWTPIEAIGSPYRRLVEELNARTEAAAVRKHKTLVPQARCYVANWWHAFDRKGTVSCRKGYALVALRKSKCNALGCLEEGQCCGYETEVATKHVANWWGSLDRRGWSSCPKYYALSGLMRNGCHGLNCLEEGVCTKMVTDECVTQGHFFGHAGWNACPAGYALHGVYRDSSHGAGNLQNLSTVSCCKVRDAYELPSAMQKSVMQVATVKKHNANMKCYEADWTTKFDHRGTAKCRAGFVLMGMLKNSCNGIGCIEKAMCCGYDNAKATTKVANWWSKLDQRGWASCPRGFAISGLMRNSCNGLNCIEEGVCTKMVTNECITQGGYFRHSGWSKCPSGYALHGVYRDSSHGAGNLKNLSTVSCCKLQSEGSLDVSFRHALAHMRHQEAERTQREAKAKAAREEYESKKKLVQQQCYVANWWHAFDRKGTVKCRPGYALMGIRKNKCNKLGCIEEGKCCGYATTRAPHTKIANWWSQLDKRGWASCPSGYAISGLMRNDCDGLNCLEEAVCSKIVTGKCVTQDNFFAHEGWSKCPHGYALHAVYRNSNTGAGGLNNLSTVSCCKVRSVNQLDENVRKGAIEAAVAAKRKAEELHRRHSTLKCYVANWWHAFDRKGTVKCRPGYALMGIRKNKCNELGCIEEGKCCGYATTRAPHTKIANWWSQLDKRGWASCPSGYAISGLMRNDCDGLNCLEEAVCSKIVTGKCVTRDNFFAHEGWSKCPHGYALHAVYRSSNTGAGGLNNLSTVSCCQLKM